MKRIIIVICFLSVYLNGYTKGINRDSLEVALYNYLLSVDVIDSSYNPFDDLTSAFIIKEVVTADMLISQQYGVYLVETYIEDGGFAFLFKRDKYIEFVNGDDLLFTLSKLLYFLNSVNVYSDKEKLRYVEAVINIFSERLSSKRIVFKRTDGKFIYWDVVK